MKINKDRKTVATKVIPLFSHSSTLPSTKQHSPI